MSFNPTQLPTPSAFSLRSIAREIKAANSQTAKQKYILSNRVSLEAAKDISPFYKPGTTIKAIGAGQHTNVFSIGQDTVLKIGTEQTPKPPNLEQILQPHSFRFVKGEGETAFGEYVDKLNITVAPKAQRVYSDRDPQMLKDWWGDKANKIANDIEGQGYRWLDAYPGNIGIHNNRPVVIDYGFIEKESTTLKGLLTKRIPYEFRSHFGSYLAPGRKPAIEALTHSGIAQYIRKALTHFGSGWRGIISLEGQIADDLLSNVFGAVVDLRSIGPLVEHPEFTPSLYEKVQTAIAYKHRTGLDPIFINKNSFLRDPDLGYQAAASAIRHERIHQAHLKNPNSKFFKQELRKTGGLQASIYKGRLNAVELYKKRGNRVLEADALAFAKRDSENLTNIYKAHFRTTPNAKLIEQSERLAWSNQMDRSFFKRMREAEEVMKMGEGTAVAGGMLKRLITKGSRILKGL